MEFIVVLARLYPKDGCQESVLEISQELIEKSLEEDGNLEYQLLKSTTDNSITFIEKWENFDYLREHMVSSHFKTFRLETKDFVKESDIQIIGAEELNL